MTSLGTPISKILTLQLPNEINHLRAQRRLAGEAPVAAELSMRTEEMSSRFQKGVLT